MEDGSSWNTLKNWECGSYKAGFHFQILYGKQGFQTSIKILSISDNS